MKLIDLTYYTHREFDQPAQVRHRHKEALGFVDFIKKKIDVQLVKHLNYEGSEFIGGIKYVFFKSKNKFVHIPRKTHKYIKQEKPDVVLVQGIIFPFQVIFLRLAVGKRCKIIAQHHGERPFKGIKKMFQRIADKCIDAYFFTSVGNATLWLNDNIIKNKEKCFEVLEGSTYMQKQNKEDSRKMLNIEAGAIFLWVGRLEKNKDPTTILLGFEQYVKINRDAKLYLIYQENDLLTEVKALIENSVFLSKAVHLVGKINHEYLEYWYSAADFYLSGSHREGSGYALIEAMACGCIPVVTDIPPFRKITGQYGFLFGKGDPDSLCAALLKASEVQTTEYSTDIVNYFNDKLSFKTIADDIYKVCTILLAK